MKGKLDPLEERSCYIPPNLQCQSPSQPSSVVPTGIGQDFCTLKKNLFIYYLDSWFHWVFVAVHGIFLVVASGDCSSLPCTGFALQWLLLLQSRDSRSMGFSSLSMQAQQFQSAALRWAGFTSCST